MRTSHSGSKLLVFTAGDPSGIGPEIIIKALSNISIPNNVFPIIVGDRGVFRIAEDRLGMALRKVDFIDLDNVSKGRLSYGRVRKEYGKASMEYIIKAADIAKRRKNARIVTAPINKQSVNLAGFRIGGHTEFLKNVFKAKNVTMMLVGGPLRVSLVTRHLPLLKVPKRISIQAIVDTAMNTYKALKRNFGIKRPRIGIAALNPHAGEGGVFGIEEEITIKPAVNILRKRIKGLTGPEPSDSLFHRAYNGKIDAVVCMYHDQGLIPLKMIAFSTGVNITLGLPVIRTSPDHGTGFDIAGKGIADPSSMIEAVKLAISLS